jgi:hypothetical protein
MTSTVKSESDKQLNIPFTPVGNVRINKVHTSVMFVGNTCYSIDDRFNKIPIARFQGRPEDYRKITIGIDVSKYVSENFPKYLSISAQIRLLNTWILCINYYLILPFPVTEILCL